jgi:hypothetical protein
MGNHYGGIKTWVRWVHPECTYEWIFDNQMIIMICSY